MTSCGGPPCHIRERGGAVVGVQTNDGVVASKYTCCDRTVCPALTEDLDALHIHQDPQVDITRLRIDGRLRLTIREEGVVGSISGSAIDVDLAVEDPDIGVPGVIGSAAHRDADIVRSAPLDIQLEFIGAPLPGKCPAIRDLPSGNRLGARRARPGALAQAC